MSLPILLVVMVVFIALLIFLRQGFKRRCPNCKRLFSLEIFAMGKELRKTKVNSIGIQNGFFNSSLNFVGFSVGKKNITHKTILRSCKCKKCGYSFEFCDEVRVNE